MRSLAFVGVLAASGLIAFVACSSDDPASSPTDTPDAAFDAPIDPGDAASDGGLESGSLERSGTRIKLNGIETAEGAFLFGVPFDTQLDVPCTLSADETGQLRCIPQETMSIRAFSDPTCQTPIAEADKASCGTTKFGAKYLGNSSDPCDTKRSVFRLGAAVTPAMIYLKNGASCDASLPASDANYFAVGAAVTPAEMVSFKRIEVPITPSLRAYVLEGDDGARIQRDQDFLDVARNKPCTINLSGDGKTRCTPKAKAKAFNFSSNTCTTHVIDPTQCVPPYDTYDDTTATTFDQPKCARFNKVEAFLIGAKRATRDEWYGDGDGGCTGPTTSARDVFDLGAEIAPSTMPELTATTTGGPRITAAAFASGGTTALQISYRLRDTTLGIDCFYGKAADGKLRCLPEEIFAAFFSDDQCTMPLGNQQTDCDPVKYVTRYEGPACGNALHVYLPGTKLDPQVTPTFFLANGSCLQNGGNSGSFAYYTLGAEVPAATFAEGKEARR